MASAVAQYLDDDGEPITAGPDVTVPPGYSLLKTTKSPAPPKKSVKELKKLAEARKPISPPSGYILQGSTAPDLSVPANNKEGLYEMYGRTGQGDTVGSFRVPYSKVQSALASGSTFYNGSDQIYAKDKAAEGSPVSWFQKIVQSPALQPVPNENRTDPTKPNFNPSPIGNMERAAARTILATPDYVRQLLSAAKSMHEGSVAGGDKFANLINPFQVPKQMYDQFKEDAKTDPKMAVDNLLGSAIGLGVVGAATHGVVKKALAFGDKPTTVSDIPVRERTNVLHRNRAGEVRQAPGQAPSVWLSPDAWHSLMGELYPEENAVETHGFNLPANDALLQFATEHQPATPNPMFGDVQKLLVEAHKGAGEGGVAIAKNRPSIQSNVNVMREELNHTWQRGLANGNVTQHLDPQVFTSLYHAIPSGMYDHLVDNGYSGHNSPEMVTEAAAKLMDGRPERFGVDQDDAVDFLDKYFKEVTAKHGAKALEELQHVRGIAKEARDAAIGEHASRTGGGQDNNAVPSVAAGGQGGAAEGVPAEGQGLTPAAEGLFNRDKDKPIWYLKSERVIGDKMKGPQSAEDVHKMLLAGGVKPEEMHWTGLDEFLKEKGKDKVTPQEIKDHLAENNLQIKEVTKGDALTPAEANRHKELLAKVFQGMSQDESNELNKLSQKQSQYSDTKYGSYVLPGAENYRELLLTTPPTERSSAYTELADIRSQLGESRQHGNTLPLAEQRRLEGRRDLLISQLKNEVFKSSHWD